MQCASSTTTSPTRSANSGSMSSRKRGLFSRSGLISSRSTASSASSARTSSHASRLVELIVCARIPSRSAAAIWLRISANSGETISAGPAPRSRGTPRGGSSPCRRAPPRGSSPCRRAPPASAVANVPSVEVPGACPLDCPDGCAWIVTVRDGEAVRLRGNPDHPFTRGALWAKVAERLLGVRERHGGEAIWPFQGTGTLGYLQGLEGRAGARLWNVLGASDHVASICSIAGGEGLRYTTGTNRGMDPEAFALSNLILLWGSNPLSSHHHVWKFFTAARERGAHLVVIDPVRTRSARAADEHIAPRPGTDAALALGLMHEVVRRGAHDEAFLRDRCVGWDAYE